MVLLIAVFGLLRKTVIGKTYLLPLLSLAYYRFAFANEQEAKISRISLDYYRFAFANEQEAEISRTSLDYNHFAFANEQEAEISRKSENQQEKSCLLLFCVRK